MWSDNETHIDLLGFQHLADAVVSIVRRDDLLPATIGVYGDWGSGKSSLLKIIQKQLDEDDGTIVLNFNGWLFESYEDAKTALMGSILEELLDHRKLIPEAKDKVKKLLKRVNGFKLATGVGKIALGLGSGILPVAMSGGLDFISLFSELKDKGKDIDLENLKGAIEEKDKKKEEEESNRRRQVREFRKDFAQLLDDSEIKRLVVVIDDLDRCLPDTIIETLEAIKLFLFVKNTAFILGADELLVKYAVRKRFPELPGERVEVGRDYLEKLVQFPVRVPPLGRAEIETYIALLFTNLTTELSDGQREQARQHAIKVNEASLTTINFSAAVAQSLFGAALPDSLKERLDLAGRIAPVLAMGLKGNPRQCKRFLNTLLMRLQMAKSRTITLQQRILAKLMLLEYFKPQSFRRLAELQSEQNGQPQELALMEMIARDKESQTDALVKPLADSGKEDKKLESGKPKAEKIVSAKAKKLESEFQLWLDQNWTHDWLKTEPSLDGIDLRPYFFFSRDLLSASLGVEINRMSPNAQEVLNGLLNESQAVRTGALTKVETLSLGDAAAIFESLAQRAQQQEEYGNDNEPFKRLFDLSNIRQELQGELILFLGRLSESAVEPFVVPQLLKISYGKASEEAAYVLLEKWIVSSNKLLAKAAKMRLARRT